MKGKVSDEEWAIRVDLAAAYRLIAYYGWDDLIFTHLSARIPGPEHHFLLNPYNLMFEEVTASSLIKVDINGNPVEPTPFITNPAGFTIHSAVHMAREDAQAVMHLHTPHGQAVSAHSDGLLPLTQTAMLIRNDLAFHDYEGVAVDLDERERLVAHLGTKNLMLLRNHGTLAVGPSMSANVSSASISWNAPARRRSWPCPPATTSTTRRRARPRPPPSKARWASPSPPNCSPGRRCCARPIASTRASRPDLAKQAASVRRL